MGTSDRAPEILRALRDELRIFSPAAARLLDARPTLTRFAAGARPRVDVLRRIPLVRDRVRRAVRLMRQRVLIYTARAEQTGTSPLEAARVWSDVADACIALCAEMAAADVSARLGPSNIGRAVFALGKLGSRELNPSSDVDLLFGYAADVELPGLDGNGGVSSHEWHVQWTRRTRALLDDVDDDGFAFRVDLDLRPEGTSGPLANSVDALESYYERFGQTWERAALLRLRAVVDVDGVGAQVLARVRPFVFPRSVHASAVDELFAMKRRVTASAASSESAGGFDVKRGAGGIREVEFVVQAHQLLHGGRHAELRAHENIVELLARLEDRGHLPHKTVVELSDAYVFLRRLEHAIQYGEDRQTQLLADAGPERDRVERAILDVVGRRQTFAEHLALHRGRVLAAFERLLGEGRDAPPDDARRALDRTLDDESRKRALTSLGFAEPGRALELLRLLERRRGSPLAPVEARAGAGGSASGEAGLDAGAHFLESIAKSPDPMAALARLPDLFMERVPRASITAIARDKRTLQLATRLLATSAPLSRLLARHHGLDEILARGLAETRLRRESVRAELAAERERAGGVGQSAAARQQADPALDDEARLIAMRRVHGRRTLETALAFFAGKVDVVTALRSLSTLADALLDEAVSVARERVSRRHGTFPTEVGAKIAVLGLGSLGGRELGFFRDLDLLFMYDGDASAESEPLPGGGASIKRIGLGEYAARMAQQVIWALTASLEEGACYEVDSRLRPSGSQGALTTSLRTFIDYHAKQSAPWERQALLRARFIAGDRELGLAAVDAARTAAFRVPEAGLGMRLLDMRARMVAERAAQDGLDLKMGEGGLADVEFAAQGLQLARGHREGRRVWSPSTQRALRRLGGNARDLERPWCELTRAREALALVDDKREPAVKPTDARLDLLQRAGVLEGPAYDKLATAAATVRDLTSRILVKLA